MKLLALDTATELCSAALWIDGAIRSREAWAPREHGGLILPMIEELLAEAELNGRSLDAIAFGRGPGAFTGLRLAAAVAQGLGYAWGLPLVPVSDLRALAAGGLPGDASGRVLACQDARMGEVYWACFEHGVSAGLTARTPEAVSPPEAVWLPAEWLQTHGAASAGGVLAVGSGIAAYPQLQTLLAASLRAALPQLRPHARAIAALVAADGLSAALPPECVEPVYLRDRVTARS